MSIDLKTRAGVARPRLSRAGTLARFALIGVALAAVAELLPISAAGSRPVS